MRKVLELSHLTKLFDTHESGRKCSRRFLPAANPLGSSCTSRPKRPVHCQRCRRVGLFAGITAPRGIRRPHQQPSPRCHDSDAHHTLRFSGIGPRYQSGSGHTADIPVRVRQLASNRVGERIFHPRGWRSRRGTVRKNRSTAQVKECVRFGQIAKSRNLGKSLGLKSYVLPAPEARPAILQSAQSPRARMVSQESVRPCFASSTSPQCPAARNAGSIAASKSTGSRKTRPKCWRTAQTSSTPKSAR